MATSQANTEILKDKCPTLMAGHEQPIYCGEESIPDPSKNQGGHIVMEDIAFQLSGDRDNPSVSVSDKAYCLPANPMSDRGQGVCMEEKVSVIEMGALVRGQGNRVWNDCAPTLRAEMGDNQPCVLMDQGGGVMNVEYDKTGTLRRETHGHEPIVMEEKVSGTDLFNGAITGDKACTLGTRGSSTNATGPTVLTNTVVRRLTPIECERLQGFPDNYTNIPWRNKPTAPDSRRYKALGNSMAVPVMRWIGRRIEAAGPIERDERAIERALYVTPGDDEQLTLF